MKAKGGPVIGEGIVIPGFQVQDERVPSFGGVWRKIFVKEAYGMIEFLILMTKFQVQLQIG